MSPHIEWAPLGEQDLPDLVLLAKACLDHDGGLPLLSRQDYLSRLFCSGPGIVGRDVFGELVAAAAIGVEEVLERWATGLVIPDLRGQGVGDELIRWAREQTGGAPVKVIAETTSPESNELFARSGLRLVFAETVMRHRLSRIPRVALPSGLRTLPFDEESAALFHTAYRLSFAQRPGFPDTPLARWVAALTEDGSFRPEDSRVAVTRDGEPAGFVTLSDNWIDQVGTVPRWRGHGLGAHLVVRSLTALQRSGASEAWLAVNVDNPSARVLYERLGFVSSGMRARYTDR